MFSQGSPAVFSPPAWEGLCAVFIIRRIIKVFSILENFFF